MRNSYQLNKNKLTIKKMNNKIIFPNLQIITLFFLIHCTYAQIIYSLHQTRPTPYTSLRNLVSDTTIYGSSSDLNYYYANLYLGNPPKKQAYIVDTGSSVTTSPCQPYCKNCGKHLNSYYTVKEPASVIECSSSHCNLVTSLCNKEKQCGFSISYSEGSSLSGIYINDTIRVGDDYQNEKGYHLPIGCTVRENNLFFTQLADGIMGLSNSDKCFVTMLYNEKIIKRNLFSLCLSQYGGYFSIGEINTTYHLEKNIKYIPINSSGFYNIIVDSIKINSNVITVGDSKGNNNYRAIVDSGTTITYIPKLFAQKIIENIQSYCNKEENKGKCGTYERDKDLGPCFRFDNQTHMSNAIDNIWLNITFSIQGGYEFVWTPRNYYFNNTDTKKEGAKLLGCLGFIETSGSRFTFGSTWMHGHDIIFNRENSSIGFVQADCDRGNRGKTPLEDKPIKEIDENNTEHVIEQCTENKKNEIETIYYIIAYSISCLILIGIITFFLIAIEHLKRRENYHCIQIKAEKLPNVIETEISEIVQNKDNSPTVIDINK